jgi:hypothetical protein
MRKIMVGVLLGLLLAFMLNRGVQAQATSGPLQIQAVSVAHTSCTITASVTTYCFASDGLWQSLSGAAFVQLGVASAPGVTSVTVCNAAGASCGSAQIGAVSLNIPKTATASVPTVTAPTVTLQ